MLHVVGCLYYLYQWCTVKQISDNEISLLIKYIKSFLWRVVKRLSYIEDARCLKVKQTKIFLVNAISNTTPCTSPLTSYTIHKTRACTIPFTNKTIILLETQFCSINLHLSEPETYVYICKISLVTLIYEVKIIIWSETNITVINYIKIFNFITKFPTFLVK